MTRQLDLREDIARYAYSRKSMSYEELIVYIDGLVLQTPSRSQKDFAEQIGVSLSYLNDVLHGRREPGEKILSAIGVRKVVSYEFVE